MSYGSLYFGPNGFLYKKAGGGGGRKNPPLGLLNCGSTTFYNKYVPGSGVGSTSRSVRRSKLRLATSCKNTGQLCGTFYPRIGIDWNVVSPYTRNGSGVYLQGPPNLPVPPIPPVNPCSLLPSITPYQVCSPWPHSRGIYNTNNGLSPFLGNQTGALKWTSYDGIYIFSSPAIGSDGTIYIGSIDYNLYALHSDGTFKWKYLTDYQIYSSPAIGSDGTIYISSADFYLYAIHSDGTLKWRYLTSGSIYSSPAIGSDGTIYIGSSDNYLYAIKPDGSLKWTNNTTLNNLYFFVTPAIGTDGTIYIGSTAGNLYAINPADGSPKWSFSIEGAIISSPAIGSDSTIYIGSTDNNLYAINPDGSFKWQTSIYFNSFIFPETSSPAIGPDGTIYIGSFSSFENYLYAIYPADGSIKWSFLTGGPIISSPVIGSDGTIYVGSTDYNFYAINSNGTIKWFYPTINPFFSSPTIGSDGTIYFTDNNGVLYAVGGNGLRIPTAPLPPLNVEAISYIPDTASISFSPPSSDGGSPIIYYTVIPDQGSITTTGLVSPITITGLTGNTSYTFTVVATNSIGSSNPSYASNSIIPSVNPSPPLNVIATATGSDSASISFSPPSSDGGTPITSYTVTSNPDNITVTGLFSPISPMIITGLTSNTYYTFTVIATNFDGPSYPSNSSNQIKTFTAVPSPPLDVIATATGPDSASISFSPPSSDGGSPILSYTVTSSPDNITVTNSVSPFSPITITGLTGNTIYTFTVVATNSNGSSDPSSASTPVTTSPSTVPSPPLNVNATSTAPDSAIVYFSPPLSTGGSLIISYTVTIISSLIPGISPVTRYISPFSPITIPNLPPNIPYTFTVVATNSIGPSSQSSVSSPAVTPNPIGYTIAPFTTVGSTTWTAPSTVTSVQYLVVGGGGGGGGAYDFSAGGGGGGGLVLSGSMNVIPGNSYNVIVGDGGAGAIRPVPYISGINSAQNDGTSGNQSSFDSIIAGGGGYGHKSRTTSPGGAGGLAASPPTPPTGGNGGTGPTNLGGGGGGGDTTNGINATTTAGGNGGQGYTSSITGSSLTYGNGGKGGTRGTNAGTPGSVNTGNGGGGGGSASVNNVGGANGGSGIVVVRYFY